MANCVSMRYATPLLLSLVAPSLAQICNSRDLVNGGGLILPALSHGEALAYEVLTNKSVVTCVKNLSSVAGLNNNMCVSAEYDVQWATAGIYFLLLLWVFLGVGVVADQFMAAIETITSQSKKIELVDHKTGKLKQIEVLKWNPTVANLTLMALGSSAPEILLNCIEIVGTGFYAGELGPGTIVGSAAFNLLIIIGICVMVIPPANPEKGEQGFRRIDDLNVFSLTAGFSMFAYIWLYLMLDVISPNVVNLSEAAITFLMCPLLVWLAWLADTGFFSKKKKEDEETGSTNEKEEPAPAHVKDAHGMLRNLNVKAKGANAEDLSNVILAHAFENAAISRAKYRIQALRGVTGKNLNLPMVTDEMKASIKKVDDAQLESARGKEAVNTIGFEATSHNALESCGTISITVKMTGPTPTEPVTVDFFTVGGTATMGDDFKEAKGTLTFDATNTTRKIDIDIVKDDELEEDEFFYVHLTNQQPSNVRLPESQAKATVRIIDDDMPGTIAFEPTFNKDELSKPTSPTGKGAKSAKVVPEEKIGHFCEYLVQESTGKVGVKVVRSGGTAGRAVVKYFTKDITAVGGMDYEGVEDGELVFETGEAEKLITINIMDDECFEKDESFEIRLREVDGAVMGGLVVATIIIKNDDEMKELGDKVAAFLQLNKDKYSVGTSSYKLQFAEAVEWPEDGGAVDVVLHLLSLPFKVIFATCPPPLIMGGWPCFFISLGYIGMVTAFIGDLAGLLGCAIGMKGSITAITFVAMGTSLPDTFASKTAAIGDKNADNSVGNVTGSNSVNVFLGLGLPWLMAAIYWEITPVSAKWAARVTPEVLAEYPGGAFYVPSGDLGFSVVIFTACAFICIGGLYFRRWKYGYELGGEGAKPFGFFSFGLWFFYISMSVLSAYKYI